MARTFTRLIHRPRGWRTAVGILAVATFAIATAVVMQSREARDAEQASAPGYGIGEPAARGKDGVTPEERTGLSVPGAAPAPAPADTTASGDAGGGTLPATDARSVIRTGSMELEVTAVTEAFDRVGAVATGAGGYVAGSVFSGGTEGQTARLTLRVPADRFGEVVAQLRGLAVEVRSASTGSQDVTGEVSDLEATLRNLRAVEAQYVQLLGRANSVADVLQVQSRLDQVRLQIDRTEARRSLIRSQAEMATLTITLLPVGAGRAEREGLRGAAVDAWEASLETLRAIGTAAVMVVVYSWWIAPLAGLGWLLIRRRLGHPRGEAGGPARP